MSSNDHKKFKTEATQKTSTDTEVISDTVLLPPYSTDHVLTVTAPSSTAGLTGQVDVELEMSPDGENWCPAQTETITAGSGGTATDGVSAEDANLNAVSTLPDPNSATPTYTYTGNKFALGSKSYDDSGNELDINNSNGGTKDFMHQLMSKDKPFNYSLWLKTKTDTQPFADDYTPVIFRHGGKDKFTNLKTVELTASGTQNLVSGGVSPNTQYINATVYNSLVSPLETDINYAASPFYNSSDTTPTQDLPDPANGFAISMWLNLDVIGTSTSWRFTNLSQINFSNGNYIALQFLHPTSTSAGTRHLRIIYNTTTSGSFIIAEYSSAHSLFSGWKHVLVYIKGTGTNGNVSASTTPADNDTKLFVDGTEITPYAAYNTATLDSSTSATITGIQFKQKGSTTYQDTDDTFKVDNLAYIKGSLDANSIASIVQNKNNLENAILPQNTVLTSLFKMGDGPNDVISQDTNFCIKNTISTNTIRFVPLSTLTNPAYSIQQYATTDAPYQSSVNSFPYIMSATSTFSISGWFKTTDTGTLFSNTGGAAATGLKVDVSGSGITASYLSSSLSTSVTGTFNDGEWHHIVMVIYPGSQLIVVDNTFSQASNHNTLVNDDLRGNNGFTLLGDGQQNAGNPNPSTTDASKLQASLSNWSLHSEELNVAAISQLYSNGHVRNIKNLPAVNPNNIVSWWKLSDTTTPEEDSAGSNDLQFQDANSTPLSDPSLLVDADGATEIVEEDQYGSGVTMSLTKRFNTTTNEWTNTHTNETCVCLSFNGFEDQAEHFAIYTHDTIDVADNAWHNLALSFSGREEELQLVQQTFLLTLLHIILY